MVTRPHEIPVVRELPTVTSELDAYATWLRAWGASKATVQTRTSIARRHLAPMGEADPATISAWLADPAWSPWTRTTYHAAARSWFRWRVEAGLAHDDPTERVRRPRTPAAAPRPLTVGDAVRVLSAAEGDVRTYVQLGMLAGLRAHEVAKIRGEDVTEEAIYVVGKGGKVAFVPTHPALWEIAQHYPRAGFWFPSSRRVEGHVKTGTVCARVSRLFASVGVEGSMHRCRHYYGTSLMRSGVNLRVVQDLMRHSSLATTAAYLGVDEDERAAAIRLLAA